MSSDEDNDSHVAVLAQDRIKKVKRTRQRVDAGEPRNSYASIPSYSPGRPSPNQNGMGAGSLNELLARSLSTCNPLKERNGEDLISEKLINGTPLELSPLLPPGMIGNGELMSQALEMAGNAGFRLGMVRTGSPPLESSKLLREILQGKKQGQFINSSTPLGSPTTGFKTSNGIITQLLKGNLSNINNGAEESDESSHNQAGDMLQVLSDDSDMESRSSAENPNEIDMNSRDKSNSDSQSMSIRNENGHGSHLPEDPILLKRARVETIVTNMRMSPTRINSDQLSNSASPEVRKQKRKQYQPQLYDSRCIAHTVPKHRRLEREMLKKQLKQMQDQLAEMQQRYCELFENESSEESEGVGGDFISKNIEERNGTEVINHSCNDMPKTEDQAQAYGAKSDRPNMSKDFELDGKVTTAISGDSSQELDPGHFIDQARKLVSEQEKLAKITDTKLDLPSKLCSQNLDWNSLAQALKTELTTSFSVIIDSILTRFVQNQVNKPILDKEIVKDLSVTSSANIPRKPVRAKVTDKGKSFTNSSNPHPTFSPFPEPKVSHRLSPFTLHPSAPLYNHTPHHPASLYNHHVEPMPEQTEPMPLIVTPKKKRHKVTDTRISPRTVSRVLSHESEGAKYPPPLPAPHDGPFPALLPASLPTTVAIPNPSLNRSDLFGRFSYEHNQISYQDPIDIDNKALAIPNHYPIGGPGTPLTPGDTISHMKSESAENSDGNSSDIPSYDSSMATRYLFLNSSYSSTLTPMHLRKAKLMFFFVRYPSSAILKMYFPDIKFNKNNTAQLIKWFSNFREFYYIQMEKYARQAISEGVKNGDELTVTTDSELYRVLNLHYNRNNHIEVPPNFRNVVEQTLREFFRALIAGKDQEQSWKKSIYKIIARMDDPLPEYFKNPNFLEQLE